MGRNFRIIALGLLLALGATDALAQSGCSSQATAGKVCGNAAATQGLPSLVTFTSLLDRAFSSAQGNMLARGAGGWTATPNPTLGLAGSAGGAITLNGSSSGSVTIRVPAAAGGAVFQLPNSNGTAGYVLTTDGAGNTSWLNNAAGGTVQSVGLSMPGIFSVSGSPVTLTGTLTATLATQVANLVWAGPATGADAAPTFRALVGADLPNPSASTLGGVRSLAAVSSQWIRQISTSGVPSASQPAFTDISGTLAAAQCPNPGASSLGCIQSFAAQTSKWINTISTSGVPGAAQPNFTDLLGSATLAQFPSISTSSVLGNASGGTAVPSALTATQVLDFIGSTQGQVLYRNASSWVALAVGTSGQVLTTGGAGADPAWATVTGTGTVTTITAGTGISFSSGATLTTTGTINLADVANNRILANVSGGAAAPSANTLSSVLDIAGSTTGNILYRSGGGWTVLAPGTNGQVLTQGASTPAWGAAGSVTTVSTSGILTGGPITTSGTLAVNATITPEGRLTLQTATPVMSTTQSAKTTIYYTPYRGNLVPLYDGTSMVPTAVAEISVATTDTAKNPAAIGASKVNDWFVWDDAGTKRISHGPDWTNDTTRSAGTALVMVNGILLNNASITNGPAASRGTYVGTTRSNASSQLDWILPSQGVAGVFGVWNNYNRVAVHGTAAFSSGTYTYSTATIRQSGGGATAQVAFVSGLAEDYIFGSHNQVVTLTANVGSYVEIYVQMDSTVSTTGAGAGAVQNGVATGAQFNANASRTFAPQLGYHTIYALELGDGVHANTFVSGIYQSLNASLRM